MDNMVCFEEWSIKTGKKIKKFSGTGALMKSNNNDEFYINEILSSDYETYILTIGREMTLWNHDTGKLIKYYNDFPERTELMWLSDNTYIVMGIDKEDADIKSDKGNKIYTETIDDKGGIIRVKKEIMNKDFKNKTEGLYGLNFSLKKGMTKDTIAITINGTPEIGVLKVKNYFDIWNVENEEKIFSIENPYPIVESLLYEDGRYVMLLEKLFRNKRRISIWNVKEHRKERSYYVLDSGNVIDIKYFASEGKLIQLKNPITIFNVK